MSIAVGRRPSGPSIEGPFCRAVRLCHALETEKQRKKVQKKKENKEKEGKKEKRRERSEKIAEI